MVKIKLFTKSFCPFCHSSIALLDNLGVEYENVDVVRGSEEYDELKEKYGFYTVPMIFIGDKFLGGNSELQALHKSGDLNELLGF